MLKSYNPIYKYMVWAVPFSLVATNGISIDFFSSPYLDISVGEVPYPSKLGYLTIAD